MFHSRSPGERITRRKPVQKPIRRLPARVAAFVADHRVAHLATASGRGRPHVVPICFALSGTTLYSVVDRKPKRAAPERLRRLRNIRQNPHVAVVVDAYREDWSRLGFVLLEGTARLIERGPEHARALRLLRRKYRQYRSMDLDGRPIIVVRIERVVAWGRMTPLQNADNPAPGRGSLPSFLAPA